MIQLVDRQIDTVIGDAIVRKIISSNTLATVTRTDQAFPFAGPLLRFLLLIEIVQLGFHPSNRLGQILVLTSLFTAFDFDPRLFVNQSDRRSGFIDVLSTSTTTGRIPFGCIVVRFQIDFDVFRLGHHGHGCRRRVNSAFGFRFRNPLHTMTTTFVLQFAKAAFARYGQDDLFEPAHFSSAGF